MENQTSKDYYEHGCNLLYKSYNVKVKNDENMLINDEGYFSLPAAIKQLLKYPAFCVDTNARNLLISIFNQKQSLTKNHLLSIYEANELHDQGLYYIRLSAEQGYAPAQYELFKYLRERFYQYPVMSNVCLDATEFIKTEAFLWCEKAAEQGYIEAQYTVAEELIDAFCSFCNNDLDLDLNLYEPLNKISDPKPIYPNSYLEKQSIEAIIWVDKANNLLDSCIKNTKNGEEIYNLSIEKLNFLIRKKHFFATYAYDNTGALMSEKLKQYLRLFRWRMPESNHCELKKYAAERGITIREVLNGLIENLLSQEKNKG